MTRATHRYRKGPKHDATYHTDSGQKLEVSKICAWCTSLGARHRKPQFVMAGDPVEWVDADKVLGVENQYTGKRARPDQRRRADSALGASERLRMLPVGWQLKDLLAGIAVGTKYIYGAENHGDTQGETEGLKRSLELAIRGPIHKMRPPGVLCTVVLQGHRSNPDQALAIRAFQYIVRTPKKRPQLQETFGDTWHKRDMWETSPIKRRPVGRLV